MARCALALLALLLLAPSARADGRFVHAFDADNEIQSTGNGFAWTTAKGSVRVTDARGRTLHDVQPEPACHTPSATPGVVLIVCGSPGDMGVTTTWLLDTHTGVLSTLEVPGQVGRIGGWWIESNYNPSGTPHGESLILTNWRSGEQRQTGDSLDAPRRDLNDPSLGIAQRPYRRRGSAILVRRGDRWKDVARCLARCGDILVWRRRLAYLDGRELIERRPRHTRRWRLPRELRDATLHRARNALVLADPVGDDWRVWRADR